MAICSAAMPRSSYGDKGPDMRRSSFGAMGPDMRRNRHLDRQLSHLRSEGRAVRAEGALKQRAAVRDLESLQRQAPPRRASSEVHHLPGQGYRAESAPRARVPGKETPTPNNETRRPSVTRRSSVEVHPLAPRWSEHSGTLNPRWSERPGTRNDLLEAELRRTRCQWERTQDQSLTSTMKRCEHELGVEFEEHWALESELRKTSLESQALQVTEESKAWVNKHEDLYAAPEELQKWHCTLDLREQELLPDWSKELVSTRIERKSCLKMIGGAELEERLGLTPRKQPPRFDLPGEVAMRRPCEVEQALEERLGLSEACRVHHEAAALESSLSFTRLHEASLRVHEAASLEVSQDEQLEVDDRSHKNNGRVVESSSDEKASLTVSALRPAGRLHEETLDEQLERELEERLGLTPADALATEAWTQKMEEDLACRLHCPVSSLASADMICL